ncbi:unnamed protein product, partial [Prorocentrum cordatum]
AGTPPGVWGQLPSAGFSSWAALWRSPGPSRAAGGRTLAQNRPLRFLFGASELWGRRSSRTTSSRAAHPRRRRTTSSRAARRAARPRSRWTVPRRAPSRTCCSRLRGAPRRSGRAEPGGLHAPFDAAPVGRPDSLTEPQNCSRRPCRARAT